MRFNKMVGLVAAAALSAALLTVPATAKQTAKECKTLCTDTIAACVAQNCDAITKKGKKKKCQNKCKSKTLNNCKKHSTGVACSSPSAAFLD